MAAEKLIRASDARRAILKEDPKLAYCIDSIPGVDVPKWISVKDRLPIPYHKVLVVDRVTGQVTTARMNDFNSFVFEDGRGHGASYWMPLPTPPKEDE